MEFEFGIVGDDLALSDDEHLSSQLSIQALERELQRQHELNFAAWDGDTAGQFQGFLDDLVCELQPGKDDYLVRLDILTRLSSALDYMDSFRGATLSTFGSFESNFYTRWADLDLSLELPNRSTLLEPISKKLKVKVLKSLLRILIKRAEARNVQFIPYARVPLITFEDSHHNISCDISVDNGVAILKSRFLRWVGEIDSRCRDLIFLVKCWAKAHCINDPKMGMLNSFALCLLVVFHLQTRSPPVLPPLNAVLDEDIARQLSDPQNSTEDVLRGCWEKIQPFIIQKFGVQNKSSVAELFITFFNQFSAVTELWSEGLAVCTFTGAWGDRTSTCGKWRSKDYVIAIEDPFDRTENCARSVQGSTFHVISGAFSSTADMLCRPDCGLSWLLEALFHWPMGTQNLGLRAWLSKVYSKEGKLKTVQVKKNTMERSTAVISVSRRMHKTAQEVEHHPNNNRVLPLDAFLENNLEVQSGERLQFNLAVNAAVPKKTRRTKKRLLVANEVENSLPPAALENVGVSEHDLVSGLDAQKGLHPEVQGIARKQKSRALKKGSQKNSLAILEGISETSPLEMLVMKSDIKVQPWENPLPNAEGPTENHIGTLSLENPVVNVEVQSGEWQQFNHAVNVAAPKKTRRTKKKLLVANEVDNSLPSAALENVGVAGHDLVSELDAQKGLHPEVQGIARKQKSRALKKGSQKNSLAILEGNSDTSPLEMLVLKSDIKVQPWENPLPNAEGPTENHIGALSLENPVVNVEVQSGEWLQFNHAVNAAAPQKTWRTKKKLLVANEVEKSLPSFALENVGVAEHGLVSELNAQKGLHPEVQGIARKQKSRALTSSLEMLVVKSDIKGQPWENPSPNAEGPIENYIGALSVENPVVNMEQTEIAINSVHSQSNDERSHKKSQSFDRNNQVRWRSRHREEGSTSHTSNGAPLCDSIIADTEILPRRNDSMPDRMASAVRPESDITQSKMCTTRNTAPIKLIDSTRKGEMVLQKGWKKTGQQHPSRAKAWAPKAGSFVCAVTEVPSIVESRKSTTVIDGGE